MRVGRGHSQPQSAARAEAEAEVPAAGPHGTPTRLAGLGCTCTSASNVKKGHEIPREKTMPTTLRMSDVTGGKLFYYV
eukprot:COSAG01_NODE_461_length_16698_cov_113.458160_15_plen_78_part_00